MNGDGSPLTLPPRGQMILNIPASIATGERVIADQQLSLTPSQAKLYEMIAGTAVPTIGTADHVGSNNYTAYGFILETSEYGVSRRTTRQDAELYAMILAKKGAVPILFTHSGIPMFRHQKEAEQAWTYLEAWHGDLSDNHWCATWRIEKDRYEGYDRWGMRRRKPCMYWGNKSYMYGVIALIDKAADMKSSDDQYWQEVNQFLSTLLYQEQTFLLSWINQVSYTLPTNGEIDPTILEIPGIRVLDLQKSEIVYGDR